MLKALRSSAVLFAILFVLTGIGYPFLTMQAAQIFFPYQANGSLITDKNKIVGSELIGQNFTRDDYFHPRPSLAGDKGYDASSSSASNLALTSSDFLKAVADRVTALRHDNSIMLAPVDLVTSSASGLDPDISPDAAAAQIARVAMARHVGQDKLIVLVDQATGNRLWGLLGDRHVNVLALNRALDALTATPSHE